MSAYLGFNTHGKARVRLVKVIRNRDGSQDILQFSVQILLEGDTMDEVFLTGDNAKVVPTDTCKNTVYCVANQHEFKTPEEFGIILCKHFLGTYPHIVNKVCIQIIKDQWVRLDAPNSRGRMAPHKHVFKRIGPMRPYAHIQGEKRNGTPLSLKIQAGFRNLDIVKTTQSGFVGFNKEKYTSLPEDDDRLLGTSIDCEWSYDTSKVSSGRIDFKKAHQTIEDALVYNFAGPSDKGVYSKSVQETLYNMAVAALAKEATIEKISLSMPNIHNLTFPLEKYGLKNKDHTGKPSIFYPIDEPHGLIQAVVSRTPTAKL